MSIAPETSGPSLSEAIPEPARMSVGQAAVWAMASQYLTFAIMFATSVIISRFFLSPDEVGLFSIALAAALLLAVLQDFGLTRYIAGLERLTQAELDRCSSVAMIFSLIIAGAIAAAAFPMAYFYRIPDLAPLLLIIAASYFFVPLAVVPMALMQRALRFSGHCVVSVGGAAVHGTVAISLAAMGFSASALAWATLAAAITKAIIAQLLQPARPFPLRLDGLRTILGFGGQTSMLYMTGALGTRTPDMIVGKLLGLFATGLFSRATSLAEQFRMLVAGAIGGVFYPAFARIRDSGQPLGPAYLRVCAGYSVLVLPGMAALGLLAEPVVLLLYGPEWIGSAPLLSLIAIQSGLMICLPLVTELPILVGKINRLIAFNVVETIASIALLALGAYLAGPLGAAASRVVYALVFFAIYMRFMSGVVGFAISDWLAVIAKSLVVTLATVAPILFAFALWVEPADMTFAHLLACTLAGALLWFAALFAVRHPALPDMLDTALPIAERLLPKSLVVWRKAKLFSGDDR